jgi:glucose-6-phosphate isomerase
VNGAPLLPPEAGASVRRLFARDPGLWGGDRRTPELADRLGWLDAPARSRDLVPRLVAFADEVRHDGFTRVVVLGMGGSSLAPEVFWRTFGARTGWPSLVVLDTTHPDAVAAVGNHPALASTLFLVSSKSGTTIETSALCAYFWERTGGNGRQFAAITDPGTPLERLATERGFRRVFAGEPDVGGRFSALTAFGLVPAAIVGVDVGEVLARAERMAASCRGEPPASNPGLELGAFLADSWRAGRDKLTLRAVPPFDSFGAWMEQLVAESTGKGGRGIVPVVGEPDGLLDGKDHAYVELAGRESADLGAEFYRWEVATALAGAWMQLNPFDQPNVAESKKNTEQLLKRLAAGDAGEQAAGLAELPRALAPWAESIRSGDYVALLAYAPPAPAHDAALARMRAAITRARGVATTAGYGPRFLHSTGQLHKGGADIGVFLQIEAEPRDDVAVPGAEYSFGRLIAAQALGDYRALKARGRRVLRVRVGPGEVAEVADALAAALG